MPSIHDGAEKQAENKKNPDVPDAEKDDDPIESFGQLLLPAASATLANVAMNNIGVDPWKRELDLSDTQFEQITKLSSQWNLDRGLSIVSLLQYVDDGKRTAELWQAYNDEQLAIARKILIPLQMRRLVQLHNQNVLQADARLNRLAHWIRSPIFAEAVRLSKSQTGQVEELAKKLDVELKEIETNSTDRVDDAIGRTSKRLRSILNEGQLNELDEKLGDSIDADRWQATLENLREELQLSRQLNELNGLENHVRVLRRATGREGNLDIWSYNIDQEFLPFQLVFMLENKLVSEEIEVTVKQRAELKKINAEWHKQNEEIAEKQKGLEVSDPLRAELSLLSSQIANKAMDDQLNVYLPHQTQRLLQIRLQLMLAGAGYLPALAHPQWQDVLKLTTDQRRQFNAIIKDNEAELKRQGDTALEKRCDSAVKAQDDLIQILESNQRERFEELFGDRVFLEWYAKAEQ